MYVPRIISDRDSIRKWYLDENFEVELRDNTLLKINKGYRFDGHSTGFFRWLFPANSGSDIVAALVHDYLIDTMPWHRFGRQYIDTAYYDVHQLYTHSRLRTRYMPLAVFIFGWLKTWGYRDYRGNSDKYLTVVNVEVKLINRVNI